jgi:hypothetical protein
VATFTGILRDDFYRRPGATVLTDPDALSGYPATNLRDNLEYKVWRPADTADKEYLVDLGVGNAGAPNYIVILNHNMGTKSATFKIQGGTTPAANDVVRGPISPVNDYDYANNFSPSALPAYRYWKITFGSIPDTELEIGQFLMGRAVIFPQLPERGFDPNISTPVIRSRGFQTGFFVEEDTRNNVLREVSFGFATLPGSFINDFTDPDGFRYWWENFARIGLPSLFMWNSGIPSIYTRDAIWGPVVDGISETLATSRDEDYHDLRFSVVGKQRLPDWSAR